MWNIFPFDPSHQPGIDALNLEIMQEFNDKRPASPGSISELSKRDHEYYWVAVSDKICIGTVGVSMLVENRAVLKKMVVKKEFRGRRSGVSEALLNTVLDHLRKNETRILFLGTRPEMIAAHKFYLKNGFARIDQNHVPVDHNFNSVDRIFFRLDL